jgi:hypothetical protein
LLTSLHRLLTSLEERKRESLNLGDFRRQRVTAREITKASTRLMGIQGLVTAAQEEADALWEDVTDWAYLGSRGQEHATSDAVDFRQMSRGVDRLLEGLGQADDVKDAWAAYQDLVATRTPPLFKSYVDIAAGLTLRGRRLDERVCAMADDLVVDWAPYHDLSAKALTIPAFDDAEQPSHMVRFGFAAWTVWSLPLFAGTFWRGYADIENGDDIGDLAKDEQSRRRVRTYLGDCLAVEMMGPAYACALILLRLDPSQTEDQAMAVGFDCVRAKVVLKMMEQAAKVRERSKLRAIFDLLDNAWREAQGLAGNLESAQDPEQCPDVQYAEPVVNLARHSIDLLGDRPGRLSRMTEARWDASATIAGRALSPPAPRDSERVDREKLTTLLKDSSVVDVLNAAWRRRLLPATCDPPAPELPGVQADEARRIATRVSRSVWPCLPRPTSGAGSALLQRSSTRRG